ncbi:hypothetical protein [Nocardioides sp. GY 10127]|uniref:hypothetical protein n=1 Tax=Nocardioides sp. GY 10127 TaxID=2569762 RepID=UPI0010A76579|nr:hypothetical protein [Nocardioides sp. GY 10127]TIC86443.1 hypothetical protein E8D37_00595 [Nocardioides sp. GY 10127]
MTLSRARGRRRLLAAGTAGSLLLAGLAATAVTAPGAQADVAADCAQAFDVSGLSVGDTVTALSVVSGTDPIEITGTYLGVYEGGIAPGVDMIMIDFSDDAAVTKAGGIWEGMSGSPVYAGDPADGNVIGAVAYGLSYGPTPIAGVTPFADMDTYLTSASHHVDVPTSTARTVARRSAGDVTTAQASQGFSRLRTPLSISGVGGGTLTSARKDAVKGGLSLPTRTLASDGRIAGLASGTSVDDVAAGGTLGVALSLGDLTVGAIGTTTSVCGSTLVGFGHPFDHAGEADYALTPADTVYIQPDSLNQPFKVANFGEPVGTITQDRLAGVSGVLGSVPDSASVTTSLTAGSDKTLSTDVYEASYVPDIAYYSGYYTRYLALDGDAMGVVDQTWSITGTEDGDPFTLTSGDVHSGGSWISRYLFAAGPAMAAYTLDDMDGVTITSVDVSSEQTSTTNKVWALRRVEQRVAGEWKKVGKHGVALTGGTLHVRAVLRSHGRTVSVPFSFEVTDPGRGYGTLRVRAGLSNYSWRSSDAASVAELQQELDAAVRNDQVKAVLAVQGGTRSKVVADLPRDGVAYGSATDAATFVGVKAGAVG